MKRRGLYSSSNGDRWYLVRDGEYPAVEHVPNASSGGRPSQIEIQAFLARGRGPEQDQLLRLIATLADDPSTA